MQVCAVARVGQIPEWHLEILMVRRAIREGWPVSDEIKQFVIDDICQIFDSKKSLRLHAATAWVVIDMVGEE